MTPKTSRRYHPSKVITYPSRTPQTPDAGSEVVSVFSALLQPKLVTSRYLQARMPWWLDAGERRGRETAELLRSQVRRCLTITLRSLEQQFQLWRLHINSKRPDSAKSHHHSPLGTSTSANGMGVTTSQWGKTMRSILDATVSDGAVFFASGVSDFLFFLRVWYLRLAERGCLDSMSCCISQGDCCASEEELWRLSVDVDAMRDCRGAKTSASRPTLVVLRYLLHGTWLPYPTGETAPSSSQLSHYPQTLSRMLLMSLAG